jgi:hypothetical protein
MRRWQWVGIAMLSAYAAVSVASGARHALAPTQSQDLAPIYMAARLWRLGEDPYLERSAEGWQQVTGASVVPDASVERAYSTPYPPVALLVVAGISGLEWPAARAWWLAINLGLALYVPWLIHRLWLNTTTRTNASSAAFFALWFGGMGLRVGLGNGQHALFWFAAMLSVVWLMTRGRPGWAGIPLALSLHKYPLTAVFLPYLVAHGWFRLLGAAALAVIVALGVFLAGLRVEAGQVVDSFVRELGWWYRQTGAGGLQGQGITDFSPVLAAVMSAPAATVGMYIVIGAATIAACWPVPDKQPIPRGIDIAAVLLLMLFATYHRVYDTIVLILPLCVLAAVARGCAGWRRVAMRVLVGMLVLVWYVDPSGVYRRIVPVALDQLPERGAFVALDLTYRLVIAAAFAVIVRLRYRRGPAMMLVVEQAGR